MPEIPIKHYTLLYVIKKNLSKELQDMAAEVIGIEKFHQVAMGQGQADIAMQLLHDCARNGEWLCLKNLHLVNAWLPTLEKVCHYSSC